MTEAPPTPAPDPAGMPEPEKALSRSRDGRMITGVCAGLGRFTGMDPVLFRIGFAVLVLASGIGVMLYVAAFLLMRQPGGRPGHLEQWTRRMFDAETVLALLAAVFAFGLIINVASGGINRGTIVVGTLLAIVLMAAHARGVDLLMMAKSMPERATGRRGMTRATPNFAPFAPFTAPPTSEPYGATTGAPGAGAPMAETPLRETPAPQAQAPQAQAQAPQGAAAQGATAQGAAAQRAATDTAAPGPDTPGATADRAAGDTAIQDAMVQNAAADDTAIHDTLIQDPVAKDTTPQDLGTKGAAVDDTLVQEAVAGDAAAPAGRADGDPPTRPFESVARLAAEPAPDPNPPHNTPGPNTPGPNTPGPDVYGAPAGWASGAPGPSAAPAGDGYRRLSDLAREARAGAYGHGGAQEHRHGMGHGAGGHGYGAGGHGYGAGEPFAPHGPYTRREPYQPYAAPYPPSPYAPPTPPPARPAKPKRPRSFIGGLTICLALIVGGIMVTMQRTGSGSVGLPVVGGAVLVTIGAGLLVAAWFGRGAALVAAGTIVALVLVGSSTVNGIPRKVGSFVWHPVGSVQSPGTYELGIGEGKLDLSDVTLRPGSRVRFDASVSMGQLTVIVPATARVEVHGSSKLGEVKIDQKVEDGTDVSFDRVLEPETPVEGDAPTIELHVKAGIGDVEVRRAA
ncbi:PspC domain-containing protein [Microbispora sp. NEAU-D428]|uniref:PspC domain-containing protein n=1 Tax=Microbispora sitophila TaxID=2771537 RepID=UPI001867DD66|nr:PspC domain-containing protein [Microbispora sitophila]MBE3013781.1 PspC domain-containing protein [Microbispora sitophila]